MADLSLITVPVDEGIADVAGEAVAAAVGGDTAPVGPHRFLYINNADASPHTATLATPGTVKGLAVSDGAVTVAASEHAIIPLNNVYRGSDGRVAITYDDVTSVTVAAFELET